MPEGQPPADLSNALRFVPTSPGFIRRTRLVNALVGSWPIVSGTGSWLEAHLVARLALTARMPNLCGSGINAQEVWDLVRQQVAEGETNREILVILTDSIAADQGRQLMRQLRRSRARVQILLLVQQDHWLTAETLADCQAQAIVHVESFGTGTLIRALQALRRGQSYLDPRLQERLRQMPISLSGREDQVLRGVSRGLSNKAIAGEMGIADTTVRDYVSSLIRKLGASNRTDVLARALAMGLIRDRGWDT